MKFRKANRERRRDAVVKPGHFCRFCDGAYLQPGEKCPICNKIDKGKSRNRRPGPEMELEVEETN